MSILNMALRRASCNNFISSHTTVRFDDRDVHSSDPEASDRNDQGFSWPIHKQIWNCDFLSSQATNDDRSSNSVILPSTHIISIHTQPLINLGLFSNLPVEIRNIIFCALMPPLELEIVLTSLKWNREGLAQCLMSLRLSSKDMQIKVLHWWWSIKRKYGFKDDPIFGLINPKTTTWVLQADQAIWDSCGFSSTGCSWRRDSFCATPNCLRKALNIIAGMPLSSRKLIRYLSFHFFHNDRRVIAAAEPEPNQALLEILKYLPKTKRLEVLYFRKPDPFAWFQVKDKIRAFQEARSNLTPAIPVSPNAFCSPRGNWSVPVFLWDVWAARLAMREFGIIVPPKLLGLWLPPGGSSRVVSANGRIRVTQGLQVGGVIVAGAPAPTAQFAPENGNT